MKRIIALVLALFTAGSLFALETDLEFGCTFGGGSRETELEGYISKDKEKITTSISGVYFATDIELNEYFGIFCDLSIMRSFNTKIESTTGITGSYNWADPNYEITSFGSFLFGSDIIMQIGDSIKIKLGGGFDCALANSKANGIYVDPLNLLTNGTIVWNYSDWTRQSVLLGLGSKIKANYYLDRFGFNAGFVFDWYFISLGETKSKELFTATSTGSILLESTFIVRPEIGITFRF